MKQSQTSEQGGGHFQSTECPPAAEPGTRKPTATLSRILLSALLAALVLLVFKQVVDFEYVVFDDDINIFRNEHLGVPTWSRVGWMLTDHTYVRRYIPLGWATLSTVVQFEGFNPRGFHVANLLLHACNAVLLFWVLMQAARRAAASTASVLVYLPAALACWWALSPMRVEVVAWSSGLLYNAATAWALIGLLLYIGGLNASPRRARLCAVAAALAYLCSLLTYPVMVGLAGAMVALELYLAISDDETGSTAGNPRSRRCAALFRCGPWVIAASVTAVFSAFLSANSTEFWKVQSASTWIDRVNQTGYFFFHYLWTLFLPLKLAPVSDTLVPPTSFNGVYALANVAAALVLAAAAFLALRRKFGLGLGLVAFVSLVFPMSPAVHAVTYTNDRYSQALGWIVAAVVILWISRLARKTPDNRAIIASSIFVALALAWTGSTLNALPRWEGTESLLSWTLQTLQKPTRIRSSVLQRLAGYNANYEGDLEKASRRVRSDEVLPIEEKETLLRELSRLTRPTPFVPVGAASLYLTAVDVDLPKNDFHSAAARLTEALRLMPDFWQAAFQLALLRLSEGEPEAAMAYYNRAIEAAGDQMGPAIRDQFLAQVAAQKGAPTH